MPMTTHTETELYLLPRPGLAQLLDHLQDLGYLTLGPSKRDDAIVYREIQDVTDLPIGWQDEQSGGHYRLQLTGDESVFAYVVGPESWKKFLFPPTETLFKAELTESGMRFREPVLNSQKRAFIGIRPCELEAIAIQDKVFVEGDFQNPQYLQRRNNLLMVAVNCTRAAATCFCSSLNTGPKAKSGFDLALTEVINGQEHFFTVEAGSEQGHRIIHSLGLEIASEAQITAAQVANQGAEQQTRSLKPENLKAQLYANLDNQSFWGQVADRCLSCGNCTMVCPTCFCSDVEDVTELQGKSAERQRRWDSCFNGAHSYVVGGNVRQHTQSRYRQWLTHKLASWQDQFDTLGCTGCGRCISWCPVGIDLTEEIERLRENDG